MSRRRSSGGGPQPPGSHRTPEDFRKLWRIAFLVCQAVNRFRAVDQYKEKIINGAPYDGSVSTKWSTSEECFPSSSSIHKISGGSNMKEVDHALDPFAVFDVKSMQEVIPHRRRDLEGSNYAARVRKRPGGACDLCKRNKRKVFLFFVIPALKLAEAVSSAYMCWRRIRQLPMNLLETRSLMKPLHRLKAFGMVLVLGPMNPHYSLTTISHLNIPQTTDSKPFGTLTKRPN